MQTDPQLCPLGGTKSVIHETSRAHEIAQELTKKGRQDVLGTLVKTMSETVLAETDAVFRTAYYLAKMN